MVVPLQAGPFVIASSYSQGHKSVNILQLLLLCFVISLSHILASAENLLVVKNVSISDDSTLMESLQQVVSK